MTTLFTKKNEVDFLQLLIRAAENALQTAQLFRTAMMGDKPPIEYVKAIHDFRACRRFHYSRNFQRFKQSFYHTD